MQGKAVYIRPKVVGPFPGPCANGSYVHRAALFLLPMNLAFLSCLQDSNIDVTIGPYETYEDGLFSYKVCF
jgi:hypothetical protein